MLENKKVMIPAIGEEVHYSRIIASWRNTGHKYFAGRFERWVTDTLGLSLDVANELIQFAITGKFELEKLANDEKKEVNKDVSEHRAKHLD